MKITFGIVLAAATLFAGATFAQEATAPAVDTKATADVANNASFGDWIVKCEAITMSRTVCRTVQELTTTESNALVVRFIALPAQDGGAVLLAQVPIGAYLPGGAVYRLENQPDAEQREMIWQRCLGQLCEAAVAIDADEMKLLTEAGGILFGYRPEPAADPVIVRADVSRFAEGIEAIRTQQN